MLEGAEEGSLTQEHTHGFAMYHAGTEQASSLVEELGVQLDDAGDIKLRAFAETSQPGVFAAGDFASRHKFISIASDTDSCGGGTLAKTLRTAFPA